MEDILTLYKQDYDKKYPVVCMDESSKQHLKDVRKALPVEQENPSDSILNMNVTEPVIYLFFSSHCAVGGALILRQDGLLLIGHYKFGSLLMKITLKPKQFDW